MLASISESKMTTISCGIVSTERRMRSIMRRFMVSLRTGNRTVRTTLSFMQEIGPISDRSKDFMNVGRLEQAEAGAPMTTIRLGFAITASGRAGGAPAWLGDMERQLCRTRRSLLQTN